MTNVELRQNLTVVYVVGCDRINFMSYYSYIFLVTIPCLSESLFVILNVSLCDGANETGLVTFPSLNPCQHLLLKYPYLAAFLDNHMQ